MSVQQLFFSDRDGIDKALRNPDTMLFESKAQADARDKTLELAEGLREFLVDRVSGLSEELADECAMALAEDKALIQKALKKPDILMKAVFGDGEPDPAQGADS